MFTNLIIIHITIITITLINTQFILYWSTKLLLVRGITAIIILSGYWVIAMVSEFRDR